MRDNLGASLVDDRLENKGEGRRRCDRDAGKMWKFSR